MRPWQFSKPKNPGFGLSRDYYLSVLSSRAVLPSLISLVNPQGENGAVIGFGAPLIRNADKSLLHQPIQRGGYALATKDRKTVIKLLVLSKEEAGFDPEAFARSELATSAAPELLNRIRATWTLLQFTFESHDAMVYPALDFLLELTQLAAILSEGVIADPLCRRYMLPETAIRTDRIDKRIDARDHVVVQFRPMADGLSAYTLGLQKFALPELEMAGLQEEDCGLATQFLLLISETSLLGDLIKSGSRYGDPQLAFEARSGGFDRQFWTGIPVFELLSPTEATATQALRSWAMKISETPT